MYIKKTQEGILLGRTQIFRPCCTVWAGWRQVYEGKETANGKHFATRDLEVGTIEVATLRCCLS